MTSMLMAASSVTTPMDVEFPNLFNGLSISYFKGFTIFGISIYWYGVLITLGVILGYIYAHIRSKDFGLDKERMFDVIFAAVIGGFFGARLYYCVFAGGYTIKTFFTTIRDGGLAIYGGIIGALLVGLIMCKVRKVHLRSMFDLAALGLLIGQCVGRWGNFVNQEAYGSTCDPDWLFGMSGNVIRGKFEAGAVVHPCFLYESAWCLLGFILLHIYSKKLRSYDGEIFLLYVAWYGLGRFFIEGLRTDSLMVGNIRVSQLIAAVTSVVAVVLFVVFKILTKKKNIPLFVNSDAWVQHQEQFRLEAENKASKKKAKENAAAQSILADDADEIDEVRGTDIPEEEESAEASETDESGAADDSSDNDDNNDNESEDN